MPKFTKKEIEKQLKKESIAKLPVSTLEDIYGVPNGYEFVRSNGRVQLEKTIVTHSPLRKTPKALKKMDDNYAKTNTKAVSALVKSVFQKVLREAQDAEERDFEKLRKTQQVSCNVALYKENIREDQTQYGPVHVIDGVPCRESHWNITAVIPKSWYTTDYVLFDSTRYRDMKLYRPAFAAAMRNYEYELIAIKLSNPVEMGPNEFEPSTQPVGYERSNAALNNKLVRRPVVKGASYAEISGGVKSFVWDIIKRRPDCCLYDVIVEHLSEHLGHKKAHSTELINRSLQNLGQKWDSQRRYEDYIDYEALDEFPGVCSLESMRNVFETLRLPVIAFNTISQPVFQHHVKSRKEDKLPILILFQQDGHVRRVTRSHQSIFQKLVVKGEDQLYTSRTQPIHSVPVSDRWSFVRTRPTDAPRFVYGKDDVFAILLEIEQSKEYTRHVAWTLKNNAFNIFEEMLPYHHAEVMDKQFLSIKFVYEQGTLVIKSLGVEDDTNKDIPTETAFQAYQIQSHEFNSAIFQPKHISFYKDIIQDLITHTKQPLTRSLIVNGSMVEAVGVDVVKHYTSALMMLEKIPVRNALDSWTRYHSCDGIQDYNLYYVESQIQANILYFDKRYTICFGMALKQFPSDTFKIIEVLRPSLLIPNPLLKLIKDTYENPELTMQMVKDIINHSIGICGKIYNSTLRTQMFLNEDEAVYYADLMEAVPHKYEKKANGKDIYFVTQSNQCQLVEGFYLLRFAILDIARANMQILVNQAENAGMQAAYIATDRVDFVTNGLDPAEVFRDKMAAPKTQSPKEEFRQIGKLRLESKKRRATTVHEFMTNQRVTFATLDRPVHEIRDNLSEVTTRHPGDPFCGLEELFFDEYDKDAVADQLEKYRHQGGTMVKASNPGVGKTQAAVHLLKRMIAAGQKVAVSLPIHRLRTELVEMGLPEECIMTFWELFGVDGCGRDKRCGSKFDQYDHVHFEEVFMASMAFVSRIHRDSCSFPHVSISATGDPFQTKAVLDVFTEYGNHGGSADVEREMRIRRLDVVFPNQFELRIPKRYSKEDVEILEKVKLDLFQPSDNHADQCKSVASKYFTKIANPLTTGQIEMLRESMVVAQHLVTINLINHRLATHNKKGEFRLVVGDKLKVKHRDPAHQLQKDDLYRVQKIIKGSKRNAVRLVNEFGREIEVLGTHKEVLEKFPYAFCMSINSAQGLSSKPGQDTFVFDVGSPFMCKENFWVGFTRARQLGNVRFVADEGTVIKDFKKQIRTRVEGHGPTKFAPRVEKTAVAEAVAVRLKKYNFCCPGIRDSPCGTPLIDEKTMELRCHFDRDCADLALTPENAIPRCEDCNRAKSSSDHLRDPIIDD